MEAGLPYMAVVPNMWYVYPWRYAKIILVIAGEKKGVRIQTRKQSYEVLVYKETYVKVVTISNHHWSYNYFNAVFICFDLVLGCCYKKLK
jgi:hypothetical protein